VRAVVEVVVGHPVVAVVAAGEEVAVDEGVGSAARSRSGGAGEEKQNERKRKAAGLSLGCRLDPAVGLWCYRWVLGCLGGGDMVSAGVWVGRLSADAVGQGSEADGLQVAGEAVEGLAVLVSVEVEGGEEETGGAAGERLGDEVWWGSVDAFDDLGK